MSNNTKIYSEAIAEAKSIRETAMANAKLALEEAFAPRMQEMMSNKLEALAEEMEEEEVNENMEGDSMDEEISLEELIAELDSLEEAADKDADEAVNENTLEEAEDEDAVGEITVDELKDIIRSVMNDVMETGEEAGEEEAGEEEMAGEEEEASEEEELNLDEILAELDSLNEGEELDEYGNSTMREPSDSAAAGLDNIIKAVKAAYAKSPEIAKKVATFVKGLPAGAGAAMRAEATELDENTELEEGIMDSVKDLAAKAGMSVDKFIDSVGQKLHGGKGLGTGTTFSESEELEEALKTIDVLRSSLNEVNLLNAKLLYVNKLFKGRNLTEAQKVKVINAFDRAETVKETKNIFETLKESFTTTKNPIKESLSFASKAAGVAPNRQPIVEGDDFMKRMQKIAGII